MIGISEEELRVKLNEEVQHLQNTIKEKDKELNGYKKEHGRLTNFFRQLDSAIVPIKPASIEYKPRKGTRKVSTKCAAVMHSTDGHHGAIQPASEIEGFGEFNPEISVNRQLGFSKDVVEWVELHRNSYHIDELCHLVTGDMMCFPKDTQITMCNGSVKNICDVSVGDIVLSNPEPRKVVAIYSRHQAENDKLITIKAIKGLPLTTTKEHIVKCVPKESVEVGIYKGNKNKKPFVIRNKSVDESEVEERRAGDLRVGDYLIVSSFRESTEDNKVNINNITGLGVIENKIDGGIIKEVRGNKPAVSCGVEIDMDADLLWLLGIYIAEGSVLRGRSTNINSAIFTIGYYETHLEERIRSIITDKFGYSPVTYTKKEKGVRVIWVNNQIIATLLFALSSDGQSGVMHKKIHDSVYKMQGSLLPLVAGWLDGDGGVHNQAIIGVTVNPTIARQMSTIMWHEKIVNGSKLDIQKNPANRPTYRIYISGKYAVQMSDYTVRWDSSMFSPKYEDGLWVGGSYCLRIHSIRKASTDGDLYDLTIDGNSYYQANGYIVHNSGDIHKELSVTNAWPSPVQAIKAGELLAKQISIVTPHFETVNVHFIVEDNHSRLTLKPQSKEAGMNSMNYVVGWYAKALLADHKNVNFNIYPMYEKVIHVIGRSYLISHGHGMRGWSGIPWYGIERSVGKESTARLQLIMEDLTMMEKVGFQRFVFGHFHVPVNTPMYTCTGSVQGTSAYDHKNGRYAKPSQSAWLVHPLLGEFDWTAFSLRDQ
jgi:hypothetical protein